MLTVLSRLQSEQLTMYYHCSGVKSFFLCILTKEGSMKKRGGSRGVYIPIAPKQNQGQVPHLFVEYLEYILYAPFNSE
jgi:hypothetical protein